MTLLADFHPKGEVSRAYGAYLEEWGTPNRSLVLIDEEGIVRWVARRADAADDPGRQPDLRRARSDRASELTLHRAPRVPPIGPGDHVRGAGPRGDRLPRPRLPALRRRLARGSATLELRLCVRHFPIASKRPRSPALHAAAEAAARQRQDAFWAMVDSIYADHGHIDDPHLWERVERARARPRALRAPTGARRRSRSACTRDFESGIRAGVTATPTAFAGACGSRAISAPQLGAIASLVTSPALENEKFCERWAANRAAERKSEYMSMFDVSRVSAEVGGNEISFETGKLARQAGGAVVVRAGDTMVLCTATMGNLRDVDFLPLTVDVEEKHYAAGKIPGSFFRREARAGEKATLTARMIDRPIRPALPEGLALRDPARRPADVGGPRPPLRHPGDERRLRGARDLRRSRSPSTSAPCGSASSTATSSSTPRRRRSRSSRWT